MLNPEYLADIFSILEECKYSSFRIFSMGKYHKVVEVVNKLRVTDSKLIHTKESITY